MVKRRSTARVSCFLVTLLFPLLIMPLMSYAQNAVNVGHTGVLAAAPAYISLEKGYFKELGIDVKLQEFAGAGEMMAPQAVGQLPVTVSSGITVGLFNAVARGMPIVVVASSAHMVPDFNSNILVVRADLKEQIKAFADLKGRKVAINLPASAGAYSLGKGLESAGLSLKDIDLLYMPWSDMVVALKNKAIDVGLQVEPFATLSQAQGVGIKWKATSDFVKDPYHMVAGVFYNADWARKNPKVATDFVVAWIKGTRDYIEAARKGPNRADIVKIATKYTRVKDPALYDKMQWPYINPNGFADKKSVEDQQNWYRANGMLQVNIPIDKLVDDSYVKAALGKLGEFR